MTVLEIENSSAISKISFYDDTNIVGICYTSNHEKEYEFYCSNLEEVKTQLLTTYEAGESVGKLIHSLRKDGSLETIIHETNESHQTETETESTEEET